MQQLKIKRDYAYEKFKMKESEMSNKVTTKIVNKKITERRDNIDLDVIKYTDQYGSEYGTDATTQDDKIHAKIIPTMNDEVERILLNTKREREETKIKLLKAKELVFSAWGLVGRIWKEIRITSKDGSQTTVDISENNILKYMSMCGLKFEKLMRNNKLIKAQYERLVELNIKRGIKKVDVFNTQNEAEIYGFSRININVNQNENSEESQDNKNE